MLGLAITEARQAGHIHIGPEHLLLGLVREGEGIAFDVLESLGIGLERARTETARLLLTESLSGTADMLSIEAQEEPSTATPRAVAPIEETRDAAHSALRTAIRAIAGLSLPAFERDLAEALLLPRLAGLIEDLYMHSDDATRSRPACGQAMFCACSPQPLV